MKLQKTRTGRVLFLFGVTMLCALSLACQFDLREEPKRVKIGPDAKANMIIYFKKGVTDQEIETFWEEILSIPHPEERSHSPRAGISRILRVYPAVQDHEAVAVTFFDDATAEQRAQIKSDVTASPIVYRVIENTAPIDVKKLD